MIKNIATLVVVLFASVCAYAGTQTPSSVKIRLKEFWVSTNKNCSSPTRIYNNPAPSVGVEITTAPNLGAGRLDPGTYECVIIVLSDLIEYTAVTTAGTCTAGQTYTKDLCHTGDASTSVGGAVVNCADSTEDTMTLYVSTVSAVGNGQNSLAPPTANTGTNSDPNGENLNAPIIKVAGTPASGTFQFVTTGALSDVHANCSPENISFNYQ